MILTPDHLDDLLELYQRVHGHNYYAGMLRQDVINNLFTKNINFGIYHNNKLVSAISLASTKIDSVKVFGNWTMDKYFLDMNLKLQCFDECYKYIEEHGYALVAVTKTKLGLGIKRQSMFNHSRPMTLKKMKIIPAGSYSGIAWIDNRYFRMGPPEVEWTVTLIR